MEGAFEMVDKVAHPNELRREVQQQTGSLASAWRSLESQDLFRKREKSRCRNDAEMPLAAGSGRGLYGDLNISAKQGQEMHKSLGREAR